MTDKEGGCSPPPIANIRIRKDYIVPSSGRAPPLVVSFILRLIPAGFHATKILVEMEERRVEERNGLMYVMMVSLIILHPVISNWNLWVTNESL